MMNTNASFRGQRGAILVVTLIIMVVMTLASLGLFRSVDSVMLLSANIGFKRDTAARANLALQGALQAMKSPSFQAVASDYCVNPTPCTTGQNTRNYSPVLLEDDASGIPLLLLPANQSLYNANMVGTWTSDAALRADTTSHGVSIFYLIERACDVAGQAVDGHCLFQSGSSKLGASGGDLRGSAAAPSGPGQGAIGPSGGTGGATEPPLFRVTVRAAGPRNTEIYVQAFVRPPADF